MPANSRIIPYAQTNTVIVTDTGSNIAKLNKMLSFLDVEGFDAGIEIISVQYASAVELAKHRGMVVIISDFFDDTDAIISAIDNLRFRQHEVILFHILDPWERDLPVDGTMRFRDMETGEEIVTRTEGIREDYLAAVQEWRDTIDEECLNRSVDRVELTTEDSLDTALVDYLVRRSKL